MTVLGQGQHCAYLGLCNLISASLIHAILMVYHVLEPCVEVVAHLGRYTKFYSYR